MLLKDWKWQSKGPGLGNQILLDFDRFHLSIIDDGYGGKKGLYEIQTYLAEQGVALHPLEMLGITEKHDTVKGFLSEAAVDDIIVKLYWLSACSPKQI